jgi:hypothetical protein
MPFGLLRQLAWLNRFFSHPDKFVTADPFLFLLACVIALVFGPGGFSLDWLLSTRQRRTS